MRRPVGVGAAQKKQNIKAKYQDKALQLDSTKLDNFSEQLDLFTKKLEDFALKYRDEIKKDPSFRKSFQQMCANSGVDPLASSKGFWAEKLGFGDFYYELAIQIIEVCLSTVHENGGLITAEELRDRLVRSRSKTRRDPISIDDIVQAVKKVAILGHGFQLITLADGRYLIQSVPGEMSTDDICVLQLAERFSLSYVSAKLIADELKWKQERVDFVLENLLKSGRAWVDWQAPEQQTLYWFPLFFTKAIKEQQQSSSAYDRASSSFSSSLS